MTDLSDPPLADECPISSLLEIDITKMSQVELEAHVTKLRTLADSPQSFKGALQTASSRKNTASGKKQVKEVNSILARLGF